MLTLKTKDINISTGGPLIAILNRLDAEKLDIQALDRIKLQHSRNSIIAAIDISETNEISFGNVFVALILKFITIHIMLLYQQV